MRSNAVKVAIIGVMASLVAVMTLLIRVPVPATEGYINLGDTMVMLSGLLFGPLVGGIAGGVGSAVADVVGGYASWAPYTFVIKGVEGAIAGLALKFGSGKLQKNLIKVLFLVIAGMEMVAGYFLVEAILFGLGAALTELPGNLFQAASGIVFSLVVEPAVRRVLT